MRKYIHVSFDLVDQFEPKIPDTTLDREDKVTPRICTAPTLLDALQAMTHPAMVIRKLKEIGIPPIIHAYYLTSDKICIPTVEQLPDVDITGERWIMDRPSKVLRRDYQIVDDEYLPRINLIDGKRSYFLLSCRFIPVHYQDNYQNLWNAVLGMDHSDRKAIHNVERVIPFRTLMQELSKNEKLDQLFNKLIEDNSMIKEATA